MNQKFIKELAKAIVSINDNSLAINCLKNLLTPAEFEEIASRLQIMKELHKGVSQRDVAKKLNVSIGTVSRGSRELKYGAPGIIKLLESWQ